MGGCCRAGVGDTDDDEDVDVNDSTRRNRDAAGAVTPLPLAPAVLAPLAPVCDCGDAADSADVGLPATPRPVPGRLGVDGAGDAVLAGRGEPNKNVPAACVASAAAARDGVPGGDGVAGTDSGPSGVAGTDAAYT